jgi:hypothetical protein
MVQEKSYRKMGRRTNPLSRRLKGMMNWPSTVQHPFLQNYVKHIFQNSLCATPHIRASTNHIWINVTLFNPDPNHPKLKDKELDFQGANLLDAVGRMEDRIRTLTHQHPFYRNIFKGVQPKSLIEAGLQGGVNEALQIYRDTPISLKINVISNPLLNAEIMAQDVAHQLKNNTPLAKVFKHYLKNMN